MTAEKPIPLGSLGAIEGDGSVRWQEDTERCPPFRTLGSLSFGKPGGGGEKEIRQVDWTEKSFVFYNLQGCDF